MKKRIVRVIVIKSMTSVMVAVSVCLILVVDPQSMDAGGLYCNPAMVDVVFMATDQLSVFEI